MYRLYFIDRDMYDVRIFDSQFETFDGAWKRYTQILELGMYRLHDRSIKVNYDSIKIVFEEPKYVILN